MHLTGLDAAILVAFFALSLLIGLGVTRRASQGFAAFFLGERRMPWWLLGVSMVATTFSTDTPNLVADIVRTHGAFGNWLWWAFLPTGLVTVFFFAKLWRRSGVLTDIEFYELRYAGPVAAFLRGFRAVYLGVFFNVLIMASVTLAAIKIGSVLFGWSPLQTVVIAATVTMVYSALGGLTGVLLTDLFQFVLAMAGSIGAAFYLLNLPDVGGLSALLAHPQVQPRLAFWPDFSQMSWGELIPIFLIPLTVQWWSIYYPGAEPGGGSYVAQRMLAARSERHAAGAALLFNSLHYALRPWPWILVAFASLVVFPDLASIEARFPHLPAQVIGHDLAYPAMLTFLPAGLLGIVVTSLAAAYMSTMSTQVNWGASILVHDVYRRFLRPTATEANLVYAGRLTTVGLMVLACGLALLLENALQAFTLMLQVGAGTGLLLMLRWFWWRVNAWAEVTAMAVSFGVALFFGLTDGAGLLDWQQFTLGVAVTTAAWLVVLLLTPPEDPARLRAFYTRVQPMGPGWRRVVADAQRDGLDLRADTPPSDFPAALLSVVAGLVGIYSLLFATGFLLYGATGKGVFFGVLAAASGLLVARLWPRLAFK